MRDAISMFEQVEKFGDDKVFLEDVMDILGLFDESFVSKFINNVSDSNIDGFFYLNLRNCLNKEKILKYY